MQRFRFRTTTNIKTNQDKDVASNLMCRDASGQCMGLCNRDTKLYLLNIQYNILHRNIKYTVYIYLYIFLH